jgi:NAD(P)-dependent dehydrogenase (short-subunit alcohol dehydrogenase family)
MCDAKSKILRRFGCSFESLEGLKFLNHRMELENKVAIVTGGNSGIGRNISELFAQEGAKVVIADMQEGEVAQNITKRGGSALFLKTDVRSSSQVQRLVEACVSEFGGLDVVCNNAGVGQNQPVSDTTEEDWDRIVDTNLKSVFLVSKYAVPLMVKRQEGAIVNTSSQLGLTALPGRGAYCASKAGVILLTRVLALEYAEQGIRVNCVCPGPIQTPMLEFTHNQEADPAEARRKLISRVPLARLGKPDEIAQAVLFLASKRSSYITGQHLVVDGGYVII